MPTEPVAEPEPPAVTSLGKALGVVVLLTLGIATIAGVMLRQRAWDSSAPFQADAMSDELAAGRLADATGIWASYSSASAVNLVHTPPLKLLLLEQWTRWMHPTGASDNAAVSLLPIRCLNTGLELLASVAAAMLVHRCLSLNETGSRHVRTTLAAITAFLCLWFNPALIWAGSAVPSAAIWPLSIVLLALYASVRNGWLISGILIAIAALLDASTLLVAPLLLLIPLLMGRAGAFARFLTGLVFVGGSATAVGFLVTTHFAWINTCYLWPIHDDPAMFLGSVSNLPAILATKFNLSSSTQAVQLRWLGLPGHMLTVKGALALAYGSLLMLCALGAAIQWRRRESRLLAALAGPMILLFALLPGMRPTATLWPVVGSVLLIGCGFGAAMLHLLISVLAIASLLHASLLSSVDSPLLPLLRGLHPDVGWMLLLAGLCAIPLALQTRRVRVVPSIDLPSEPSLAAGTPLNADPDIATSDIAQLPRPRTKSTSPREDDIKLSPWQQVEAPPAPAETLPLRNPSGFVAPRAMLDEKDLTPVVGRLRHNSTVPLIADDM